MVYKGTVHEASYEVALAPLLRMVLVLRMVLRMVLVVICHDRPNRQCYKAKFLLHLTARDNYIAYPSGINTKPRRLHHLPVLVRIDNNWYRSLRQDHSGRIFH